MHGSFTIGSLDSQSFSWHKLHQLTSSDGIPTDIVWPIWSITVCLLMKILSYPSIIVGRLKSGTITSEMQTVSLLLLLCLTLFALTSSDSEWKPCLKERVNDRGAKLSGKHFLFVKFQKSHENLCWCLSKSEENKQLFGWILESFRALCKFYKRHWTLIST